MSRTPFRRLQAVKRSTYSAGVAAALTAIVWLPGVAGAENLHFTYLWHLEQPIYWPDHQPGGPDRYEVAWPSILRTDAGAAHPGKPEHHSRSQPCRG